MLEGALRLLADAALVATALFVSAGTLAWSRAWVLLAVPLLVHTPLSGVPMTLRTLLAALASIAIAGGAIIGLVCAPFMFSASIVDVTGAGLGCVTGAILIAAGLRTLAVLVEVPVEGARGRTEPFAGPATGS